MRFTKILSRFGAGALMVAALGAAPLASADESQAKALFKAMSDYMGKQKIISFDIDTSLEIVTQDQQKLSIANSGSLTMTRPDKLRVSRRGGFADVELVFDGKTAVLLRKDTQKYAKEEIPGSIENLVEEMRTKYKRPLPAADLLSQNIYDELMPLVTNVKDLGSGVIRGIECDHLAFRTEEVDWQIWIAQGDRPYPVRFMITSSKITGSPQYQVDVMNFKTDAQVTAVDYTYTPTAGVKLVKGSELTEFDELPSVFKPQP